MRAEEEFEEQPQTAMTGANRQTSTPAVSYDALLLVSFGGPEGPADVEPFLDNVLRGRKIPPERRRAVAEHYLSRGGRSPINQQNRALLAALRPALAARFPGLRLYWGNRNWHPLLADVVAQMRIDGVRRALAFVTSAFGSYSGCRQYQEDLARARVEVGPDAPEINKLRLFYNHPGFISAVAAGLEEAWHYLPTGRRDTAELLFTAHSIPVAMASAGPYVAQLRRAVALVADAVGHPAWRLAFQSRSGSPAEPWLEPELTTALAAAANQGRRDVVIVPIGFLSDHMEVVHDLDIEARAEAERLGLNMIRAATPGARPELINMIVELVAERVAGGPRRALGPPPADVCAADCCIWTNLRPATAAGMTPAAHSGTGPVAAGSKTK